MYSIFDDIYAHDIDGILCHGYVTDIRANGVMALFDDGLFFVSYAELETGSSTRLLVIASEVQ